MGNSDVKRKRVDDDLLFLSFSEIYDALRQKAENVLYQRQTSKQEVEITLVSLEMFLVLCRKWMYSKIDTDDKKTIKEARRYIRVLHRDVYSKLMTIERPKVREIFDVRLPQTDDEELAAKLEGLEYGHAFKEELAPSHEHVFLQKCFLSVV